MELGGYGFEKPELLKLAEQIYECKGKKQELELELSSVKFHERYLPQRREIASSSAASHFAVIAPLTFFVVAAVIYILYFIINADGLRDDPSYGFILLVSFLFTAFGGYADIMLLKREIGFFRLLYASKDSAKAERFDKKHNVNSIQNDEDKTKERIRMLTEEINSLDEKIVSLSERQDLLLKEREERENVLREKGILFDEDPNKPKEEGKFTLKEDDMWTVDVRELHEFYEKEQQYILNYQRELDIRVKRLEKEILEINENYEIFKKQLLFSVIIYILVAIIQSAFTGFLAIVTCLLCGIGSIVYILYFESKWKRWILLYLVEQDNELTREYAFCNNMVPVRNKREEIMQLIEENERELLEIKKKKESIAF